MQPTTKIGIPSALAHTRQPRDDDQQKTQGTKRERESSETKQALHWPRKNPSDQLNRWLDHSTLPYHAQLAIMHSRRTAPVELQAVLQPARIPFLLRSPEIQRVLRLHTIDLSVHQRILVEV